MVSFLIRKVIFRRAKAIYWATILRVNKKDHQKPIEKF